MSGVVLRCPNCGTTKVVPGECEACHEAQVRHFCTNHTPGLWLDAPACPRCGARFGEVMRPPAAPPSPAPAPTRTPPPRGAASPTSSRREVAGGPWARGRREGSPAAAPAEVREAGAEVSAAREALKARLPKLLRGVTRVRRAPAAATHLPEEAPSTGPALGGCLARALFLAMFLIVSIVALFLMLGGSLFQMFKVYYY